MQLLPISELSQTLYTSSNYTQGTGLDSVPCFFIRGAIIYNKNRKILQEGNIYEKK